MDNEKLLLAVLNNIGSALILVNQDGVIKTVNKAAVELFGYRDIEMVGQPMSKIIYIISKKGQNGPDQQESALSVKKEGVTGYYVVRKDGRQVPVVTNSSTVLSNTGVPTTILVFTDITTEKEVERAMSDFVAIASHQLRTPLGSMKWNLQMLLNGDLGPLEQPQRSTLDLTLESLERFIRLVNDLLTVSRIEQGRVVDQPDRVDFRSVVEETVGELASGAASRHVKIVTDSSDTAYVFVGPRSFREAVENLVSNAIKYSLPDTEVKVCLKRVGEEIMLSVSDQGIGINDADKPRIFSKFFRASNAIKGDTEGTGLGLYVVKSYIESWGGQVWFDSIENKGSTFYIKLKIYG